MAFALGAWVRDLRPRPDVEVVQPVSSPAILAAGMEQIGAPAVQWAMQLGYQVAVECSEMFPIFGKGAVQLNIMRWGTESVAITSLRMIDDDTICNFADPAGDAIQSTQEYVHRGIPLPTVWKAVQKGHARLTDALMSACLHCVPADEQPRQLKHMSEVLFAYFQRVADSIIDTYVAEQERWMMTAIVARQRAIEEILAGRPRNIPKAESLLRYSLVHRYHLGAVLWFEETVDAEDKVLQKVARELLETAGAEQTLIMPRIASATYAWANGTHDLQLPKPTSDLDRHGIRCAVGRVHRGVTGFAQTCRDAEDARQVIGAFPALNSSLSYFDDLRLLTLVSHDVTKLHRYVSDMLGPLAGNEDHIVELRTTALEYLRRKRSPLAVAKELYVARNTVRYRLQRIEEMLGHSLEEHTLETWIALIAKDAIRGTTPPDADAATIKRCGSVATFEQLADGDRTQRMER